MWGGGSGTHTHTHELPCTRVVVGSCQPSLTLTSRYRTILISQIPDAKARTVTVVAERSCVQCPRPGSCMLRRYGPKPRPATPATRQPACITAAGAAVAACTRVVPGSCQPSLTLPSRYRIISISRIPDAKAQMVTVVAKSSCTMPYTRKLYATALRPQTPPGNSGNTRAGLHHCCRGGGGGLHPGRTRELPTLAHPPFKI